MGWLIEWWLQGEAQKAHRDYHAMRAACQPYRTPRVTPDNRDAEWIARELGDVPPRTAGATLADAGFPMLGAMVDAFRMRD